MIHCNVDVYTPPNTIAQLRSNHNPRVDFNSGCEFIQVTTVSYPNEIVTATSNF